MDALRERLRRVNKSRLLVCVVGAFLIALLIATILGRSGYVPKQNSVSIPPIRGEPRRSKRNSDADRLKGPMISESASKQQNVKDPFANRPRLQTRNGHLVIESSRDKNIEFRTNGARGSITLNDFKLDQLFGVVKALDRSRALLGSLASNDPSSSGILEQFTDSAGDHYDAILRALLTSGQRLTSLERMNAELRANLTTASKRLVKLGKGLSTGKNQLKNLRTRLDIIENKLKQNNCFDSSGQPVCKNGATCINNFNSFKCLCPDQYEGNTCERDVDECAKYRGTDLGCQNGAKCNNYPGGYSCECPPQFHGVHCTEKHDDCALSSSATLCGHGKCVNLARTVPNQAHYECICDQGWTTDPTSLSPACVVDVNECLAGSANQTASSASAYPCSQNPFVECNNLPGSFQCAQCPPGFTGNGRVCRDVDECTKNNGGCSTNPMVECINTFGSRRCAACPPGFVGDGQECRQASICTKEPNGGCHPNARCLELAAVSASSSRLCVCQYPYVGIGIGPQGCHLVGSSPMEKSSQLSNTTIAGLDKPQDDCRPNPCLNGAECRQTDNSFECICPSGFAGHLCDQFADLTCGGALPASEGTFAFPVGGSYAKLIELMKGTETNTGRNSATDAILPEGQRNYRCLWTIVAAKSNMSIKLSFSQLVDRLNPGKPVQVWLAANSYARTSGRGQLNSVAETTPHTCSERLDVRERLEPELVAAGAERRLMARLCSKGSSASSASGPANLITQKSLVPGNQSVALTVDASAVDLEYSFSATRTQFGEPSLGFAVHWAQVEPTCGGQLPVSESGSLASPQFPEFYSPGIECRYILRVPANKRMRIQFGELTLRTILTHAPNVECADSLTLLDGAVGSDRPMLLRHCANNITQSERLRASSGAAMQPIVSSSSTVELVLRSSARSTTPLLRPRQQKGFYLTYSSEPATPGCGGLYTTKQATIVSDDYEPSKSFRDKSQRELAISMTSYFMNQQQQQQLRRAQKSSRAQPQTQAQIKPGSDAFEILNEPDLTQAWQATRSSSLWQHQFNGLRRKRRQAALSSSSPEKSHSSSASTSDSQYLSSFLRRLFIPERSTYARRCEYEIRPENQRRDHRIQIDSIDMLGTNLDATSRLYKHARHDRCGYTRLSIYDGLPSATGAPASDGPTDGGSASADASTTTFNETASNVNLLARFCGSDLYDSKQMQSIVSSGHVLYLVYETRQKLMDPTAGLPGVGFKLRYSTICSGTYRQLSGEIQTELDEFVTDCVYHIALPPNNTISLSIEPRDGVAGEQAMTLPDGSCAVQAMFVDGAMQRGWSAPEQRQERTLSFPVGLASSASSEMKVSVVDDVPFAADDQLSVAINSVQQVAQQQQQPQQRPVPASRSDDFNEAGDDSATQTGGAQRSTKYWQYASNPVQDVKLFDVCHVQALSFDSIWNHVSLRFRLVDSPRLRVELESGVLESASGDQATDSSKSALGRFQLVIKYQSESACGGIISWPPEGTIKLVSSESVQRLDKYPLTINRWEQLHRREFVNQCAWILRNKHNQAITVKFDAPVDEIRAIQSDWFAWKRMSLRSELANSAQGVQLNSSARGDVSFNCSEAFVETIELYEPSLNRSRILCPTDLVLDKLASNLASTISATTINKWTTQSDTVYVRLHNASAPMENQTGSMKTSAFQRRPLKGNISMVYTLSQMNVSGNCGGRVLQDSGVIRSPRWPFRYPEHSNCVWILETGKQQQIRLNFSEFELEDQIVCQFDYLELRNGPTNESPLIGRFCGNQLKSRVIITQSSHLWLKFISDGHISRTGFEMHFDTAQTGCGGLLSGASGQLDSPNYPYAYAHSADCEWTIEVSQSNRVRLNVIDLDLSSLAGASDGETGNASNCTTEGPNASYIEVFDAASGDRTSKSLGRYCHMEQLMQQSGNSRFKLISKKPTTGSGIGSGSLILNLPELVSTSNKLFISYKSQALDVGRGFRLSFEADCNGIELTGTQGAIESPGYPSGYSSNKRCSWIINAPAGSNIAIIVADLDLEDSARGWQTRYDSAAAATSYIETTRLGSSVERLCNEDFVEIYADLKASSNSSSAKVTPKKSAKLCGRLDELSALERLIEIPTNRARVVFNSDSSFNLHGFRLEWRAQGCGGQQVGGDFIKPIEFSESLNLTRYTNNEDLSTTGVECRWTIDMSRNSLIGSLDMQVNSDLRPFSVQSSALSSVADDQQACETASLTIYDGLDDKGLVLLKICNGSFRSRESVITSSGQVTIKYYTKPTQAAPGASKSKVQFGRRNFQIQAWPASRYNCQTSVFDVNAPYNQLAGTLKSPNYPDLYSAKSYHCNGLVTVQTGRIKFVIDELDIPSSSKSSSFGADSLDTNCTESGSYLQFGNVVGRRNDKRFCGKLETQPGESGRRMVAEYVSKHQGALVDFVSRGSQQGRWKVSYTRLCGSVTIVESSKDFATPNYPNRPTWISSDSTTSTSASAGSSTDQVCIWRLQTSPHSKQTNRRIHLHVINFVESADPNRNGTDCLRVYEGDDVDIRASTFNLTDIDSGEYAKSQVIKLCKQTDLRHTNLQYSSTGTELTLVISGGTVAKVRADSFDNYCGADFVHDAAEFASPNYPQAYGSDLDCHYFISGPPGSHVALKFSTFELPDAAFGYQPDERSDSDGGQAKPSCDNVDHIEIRSLVPRLRLAKSLSKLGQRRANRFAIWSSAIASTPKPSKLNSTTPATTTVLRSDGRSKLLSPSTSTNQSEVNSSLMSGLSARFGLLSKLDLIYRDQTGLADNEAFKRGSPVLALDEFYESSVLLGRFCGHKAPKLSSKLLAEQILIRLRSHRTDETQWRNRGARQERGFLATYQIEYGGLIKVDPADESQKREPAKEEAAADADTVGAGDSEEPYEATSGGLLASPLFPSLTRRNETIKWTFETRFDSVLQFEVVSMQIGHIHQDCADDSLSIFDGLSPASSVRLAKLCGEVRYNDNSNAASSRSQRFPMSDESYLQQKGALLRAPIYKAHEPSVRSALIKQIRTTTNVATVVYDNLKTESMFLIRYTAISRAELSKLNDTNVIDESVVLHEEFDKIVEPQEETNNYKQISANKSCSAMYELSYANGGDLAGVSLSSPTSASPRDLVECQWVVYTRENTELKLMIDASLSSVAYIETEATSNDAPYISQGNIQNKRYDYCFDRNFRGRPLQYVVVHDGATQLAPEIARYCLPAPPVTLISTGRHLLVRYVQVDDSSTSLVRTPTTDSVQPSPPKSITPFRARVELNRCGGQYHVVSATRLKDRYDSSKNYSNYVDCTYYLFASSTDKVLIILNQMSEFDLASSPSDANCTVGDYIEVRDLPIRSGDTMDYSKALTGRSLGRYCAGRRLGYIESPGTALAINFHTDSSNTAKGFELYVMSTQPHQTCPRGYQTLHADAPFGLLMSPNWPHGFTGKRHCKYQLVAPMSASIELTFVRYKRQRSITSQTCIDKLTYLADNEASALRFDTRPLADLMSPISGTQLRQLVRELPCKVNRKVYEHHYQDYANPTLLLAPDSAATETGASPVQSFDTLSGQEYERLVAQAPTMPLRINSNGSHVLMLDYETSGRALAPDEGFLAVYKLTYNVPSSSSQSPGSDRVSPLEGYQCGHSSVTAGSLLMSGKYGTQMREEDPYVQCEWNLKLSSSSSGSMGSASSMYYVLSDPHHGSNGASSRRNSSSSSDDAQVSEFMLTPADSIGTFTTSFIVFQVLEIPPARLSPDLPQRSYFEERWTVARYATSNEACGLNRLIVSDVYSFGAFFACGNLTNSYRWLLLDEPSITRVSLRTRNLPLKESTSGDSNNSARYYRGMRAYFHEKECLQIERLIGESVRIRSHSGFNLPPANESTADTGVKRDDYGPGICRWQIQLKPGKYELTFASVHFRPPSNGGLQVDSARGSSSCANNTEDYLEIRASSGPFAPVLERYCYMNERNLENNTSKQVTLNTTGELTLLFVAGLNELSHGKLQFESRKKLPTASNTQYGFDIRIRRVQNSTISDFCKPYTMNNIYTFIRSTEFNDGSVYALSRSLRSFLYPRNTHCTVDLVIDEDYRFNITFKGIFDIEPSKDCQNDYLQLDDLIVASDESPATTPATIQSSTTSSKSKTTTSRPKVSRTTVAPVTQADMLRLHHRYETKTIKRLCGRDRPKESFLSAGNKVRVTFHSDSNSLVGKGFLLEYTPISVQ